MTRWRRILWGGALLLTATLAACTDKDAGPGVVEVVVSDNFPLGAVVVEVTGEGITGVQDIPGGWTEGHARTNGNAMPSYRVIAVAPEAGEITIRLDTERAGAPLPTAEVLEASDGADRPLLNLLFTEAVVRRVR